MTLKQIAELLHAQVLNPSCDMGIEVNSAIASDLMSDVLIFNQPASLLVTGLTNNQVVRTCEIAGITAILFVRNKMPTPETIQLSGEHNLPIFLTRSTMFEACGILYAHGITGLTIKV